MAREEGRISDPMLRPRSKPLRVSRGSTLVKVAQVLGATASLAVLGVASVLLPSFLGPDSQHKNVLLSDAVPMRAARIREASQSLANEQRGSAGQSLFHGVVYPPNYYGHYDMDGVWYKHPHAHVQHISVDDGTIGIGNTGRTWFISHHGPEEEASGCTSGCDTAQSRLMTAAGGMMQAAALNDLKRNEAATEQQEITKTWAAKMRAALDVLDPLPPPPSAPKGICHTTVACEHCRGITEEQECKEARGVWEASEDWRGGLKENEQEVSKKLKDRMDEAVNMAGQIPN